MATRANELGEKLSGYFDAHQPFKGQGRVLDLTKIDQGWETEIYSFSLGHDSGEMRSKELILRMYAGDNAEEKSTKEFKAMTKLHEVEFPIPKVYSLETNRSVLGKPFVIMEKVDGRPMGKIIDASPSRIEEMVRLFCKIFVDLHGLDTKPFLSDRSLYPDPSVYVEGGPDHYLNNMLRYGRQMVTPFKEKESEQILDWLEQKKEDIHTWRLSPIHLDYHFYNILISDDGKPFVIDWTNFEIADYRIDVAWTLMLASTYGHPEARDYILSMYERIAGNKVEDIEYFEAMAAARRLFSIFISLSMGPEKLGMRPEAAEMMKNQVGHLREVVKVLRERTGIVVTGFDDALKL